MRYLILITRRAEARKDKLTAFLHMLDTKQIPYVKYYGLPQDIKATVREHQADHIAVLGGDGSLRTVLQQLWENKLLSMPIAAIPFGSTNVVARILGRPNLLDPKVCPVRLACLDGRYVFILGALWGEMANITIRASDQMKKQHGFFGYIVAALRHVDLRRRTTYGVDDKEYGAHSLAVVTPLCLPWKAKTLTSIPLDTGVVRSLWMLVRAFMTKRPPLLLPLQASMKQTVRTAARLHIDGDEIPPSPSHTYTIELLEETVRFLV